MSTSKATKACGGRLAYECYGVSSVRKYHQLRNGHHRYRAKCEKCGDETTNNGKPRACKRLVEVTP
mgnify:CR=1 FL=1